MKIKTLQQKLSLFAIVQGIPLLLFSCYLIYALVSYSHAYDSIVSRMTVANSYNLNFKEELDESIYKRVVSGRAAEPDNPEDQRPYVLIAGLREDFARLNRLSIDAKSKNWLNILLRNLDTLEDRISDIEKNLTEDGHYDENIEMLDNNIYILTELIQDDIQYYIYFQAKNIELLKQELNRQVRLFLRVMAGSLLCITLLAMLALRRLGQGITVPIAELGTVAQRIAMGDFSARSGSLGEDEIGTLGDRVNDMAAHLELMVRQIKEDEKRMRHAELRLLQEQINPHFLYNTLDTIIWLIEGRREEEAEDVVVALSDYFRLVLSHGREFITLRDEEKHILSYLQIQRVRYRDILSFECEIEPELYRCRVLKMTLQPVVENALYHGIKYKRGRGLIRIVGRRAGDELQLLVQDDGIGMKEAELMRLREEIRRPCRETERGFGLANVNERIRMNFGERYGLSVDSEEGRGTEVRICMPAEPFREEC